MDSRSGNISASSQGFGASSFGGSRAGSTRSAPHGRVRFSVRQKFEPYLATLAVSMTVLFLCGIIRSAIVLQQSAMTRLDELSDGPETIETIDVLQILGGKVLAEMAARVRFNTQPSTINLGQVSDATDEYEIVIRVNFAY